MVRSLRILTLENPDDYPKHQVRRVAAVSGAAITLDTGLKFAVAAAEGGQFLNCYPPRKVEVVGGEMSGASPSVGLGYFQFYNFADVQWDSPRLLDDPSIDVETDTAPRGIYHLGGDGFSLSKVYAENMGYAICPAHGTRKTAVNGITAHKCRHPVDPSTWADGVIVNNSVSTECYQTVGPHASFDVHFNGVSATGEGNMPYMRTIGGSIRGAKIDLAQNATPSRGLMHYTDVPSFTYLYDSAQLLIDGLEVTQGGVPVGNMDFRFGRVSLANIEAGNIVTQTTLSRLVIGPNVSGAQKDNAGGTDWDDADAGIRITPTVQTTCRGDAVNDSGVRLIDANAVMVAQSPKHIRMYGSLAEGIGASAFDVKVITNVFGSTATPASVLGRLRVFGAVRHNSGSGYDIVTHEWTFRHRIAAASFVTMATAPSLTRNAVATNSLTLALSSPSQEGATELGASKRHNISFTLTPSTAGTSPNIDVSYELDLWATT